MELANHLDTYTYTQWAQYSAPLRHRSPLEPSIDQDLISFFGRLSLYSRRHSVPSFLSPASYWRLASISAQRLPGRPYGGRTGRPVCVCVRVWQCQAHSGQVVVVTSVRVSIDKCSQPDSAEAAGAFMRRARSRFSPMAFSTSPSGHSGPPAYRTIAVIPGLVFRKRN